MRQAALIFLMLAMLPFAGCVANADDPVDAAANAAATDAGTRQDAPVASPTHAPSPDPEPAKPARAEEPAAEPVAEEKQRIITPMDWKGATGSNVCVPGGPGWCEVHEIERRDSSRQLQLVGQIEGELTLTWEAAAPMFETMTLFVSSGISCGENCFQNNGTVGVSVTGVSPLVLLLDHDILNDTIFVIGVSQESVGTPPPVMTSFDVNQAFHLEGVLESWGWPTAD